MKTEKEILERIEHIKTLSNGYGINERRIKELEWVLKSSKLRQVAVISTVCSCKPNTDLYCETITKCNKCHKEVKIVRTN